eukprot:3328-Rhodomonas_salina.3
MPAAMLWSVCVCVCLGGGGLAYKGDVRYSHIASYKGGGTVVSRPRRSPTGTIPLPMSTLSLATRPTYFTDGEKDEQQKPVLGQASGPISLQLPYPVSGTDIPDGAARFLQTRSVLHRFCAFALLQTPPHPPLKPTNQTLKPKVLRLQYCGYLPSNAMACGCLSVDIFRCGAGNGSDPARAQGHPGQLRDAPARDGVRIWCYQELVGWSPNADPVRAICLRARYAIPGTDLAYGAEKNRRGAVRVEGAAGR